MTRKHWAASILAILAVASFAVALAGDDPVKTVRGEVAAVNPQDKTVTVKPADGDPSGAQPVTATIDAKTKISKSGRMVDLAQLQSGDPVVLTYRMVSGGAIAVTIGVEERKS